MTTKHFIVHLNEAKTALEVSPKIGRTSGDTIIWDVDLGNPNGQTIQTFQVNFEAGKWPFTGNQVPINPGDTHTVANAGSGQVHYKYSVAATEVGGQPISLDPHIIVDDGLGTERHHHHETVNDVIHGVTSAIVKYQNESKSDPVLKFFSTGVHAVTVEVKPDSTVIVKFG